MRACLLMALLCLPLSLACGDKDGTGDDTGEPATDGGTTSTGWEFSHGAKGAVFTSGDVAVSEAGDVWMAGKVSGTLDLGSGEITTLEDDLLAGRISPDPAWQGGLSFGSAGADYPADIAVHPDGGALVAGYFWSAIALDPDSPDEVAPPEGGSGTWLSRYDSSLSLLWSLTLGGIDYRVETYGVAATTGGDAVIGGWIINDRVDFDPGAGSSVWSTSGTDAWLAGYDSDGAFAWLNVLDASDGGSAVVLDIADTPDGGVVACGYFSGAIDVDDGPDEDLRRAGAGNSAFIVKVEADGDIAWVQTFGDAPNTLPRAIDVNSGGEIAVAGGYDGETDLDPGDGIQDTIHQDHYEVFIAVYSADGELDRHVDLVGGGYDEAFDVAIDDEGSVYALGVFTDALDTELDAEEALLTTDSGTSGFIVGVDATTRMMWIVEEAAATRLAVDRDNKLYLSFVLDDAVDLLLGDGVAVFTADRRRRSGRGPDGSLPAVMVLPADSVR